jgi:ubiquinone/menaquinone biosynthesis C-methylase UbiE
MNTKIYCPKCKEILLISTNKLICSKCKKIFSKKDGYFDFLEKIDFGVIDISTNKLKEILEHLHQHGYKKTLIQFSKDSETKLHLQDVKSADAIFHCLGKNNLRCLEIGSNLGKITENLSNIFHEVYSLETSKEKIEIQKYRFEYLNQKNIILIRGNPLELPFPENYFDLIICNESFEFCELYNLNSDSTNTQINLLNEIKRTLTQEGCLCLGVQNKSRLQKLFRIDKEGFDKNNPKSKISSFSDYEKLLKKVDFNFKSYWVLPSIKKPYFSGKIDDDLSYEWFFQNLKNFLLKNNSSKIKNYFYSIISKLNKFITIIIKKKFVPNYIFCCYKNNIPKTLEDFIIKNTNSFLMISRRHRILYILLEKNKEPKKIVSVNRYGLEIPEKIVKFERVFPKMKEPMERLWEGEWIEGKPIDPIKIDQVFATFDWLRQFQKDTQNEIMNKEFIEETEIEWIRNSLKKINGLPLEQYDVWLNEYLSYICKQPIHKTAVHGDFWYGNILINLKTHNVNVIDWENFKEVGNPFYDYMLFVFNFMIMFDDDLKSFKSNFTQSKKFQTLIKIQKNISKQFDFECKLIVLLRWEILWRIANSQINRKGKGIKEYMQMLEFISNKEDQIY